MKTTSSSVDLQEPLRGAANPSVQSAEGLAKTIVARVMPNNPGGWTFDPRRGQGVNFGPNTDNSLYVVSVARHELQLPEPPDENTLRCWVRQRLELLRRPGYFVGGWPNDGKFFLDVSLVIQGLDSALRFARANQQLAMFHPQSNQSIRLLSTAHEVPASAGNSQH